MSRLTHPWLIEVARSLDLQWSVDIVGALRSNVWHHWARAIDAAMQVPLDRVLQCMPLLRIASAADFATLPVSCWVAICMLLVLWITFLEPVIAEPNQHAQRAQQQWY